MDLATKPQIIALDITVDCFAKGYADGSPYFPFPTIQKAMQAAPDGPFRCRYALGDVVYARRPDGSMVATIERSRSADWR